MLRRPTFYLALIGIVAAAVLVLKTRQGDPPSEPMTPPSQTPYQASIGARGLVESLHENVRVSPTVAGRIERVAVVVGDKVKKGDVLFELDGREAQSNVRMQEAQLAVLEAKLREFETALADRRDQLQRTSKLREKNVASLDQIQRDAYAYQAAERQFTRAQADLSLGQAQLEDARVGLDLLTVRAPRAGTILQVNIRDGEYAPVSGGGDPLILLGDIQTLQLRADVDESDAHRIAPDCEATAFLKGTRVDPIPLKFLRIEPYVTPKRSLTGESTERVDTRVLQVIFQFENPPVRVYPGQQMDVFIKEEPGEKSARL